MDYGYDHYCFACGERNPQGLKVKFFQEGEKICTIFQPGENHQGYPGIMHGGLTSTLLDEVMSRCVQETGAAGLTAKLEVRFRQSIPLYRPVRFEAWIVKKKGHLVELESCAILDDGQVAAEGKSKFMIVDHPVNQKT